MLARSDREHFARFARWYTGHGSQGLLAIFATVFLAELGDKTQLATVLFAANRANSAWLVFAAASLALVAACALAVLVGNVLAQHVNTRHLIDRRRAWVHRDRTLDALGCPARLRNPGAAGFLRRINDLVARWKGPQ